MIYHTIFLGDTMWKKLQRRLHEYRVTEVRPVNTHFQTGEETNERLSQKIPEYR
jgi:hypothetical protein